MSKYCTKHAETLASIQGARRGHLSYREKLIKHDIIEYSKACGTKLQHDSHCFKSLNVEKKNQALAASSKNEHSLQIRCILIFKFVKPQLSHIVWASRWLIILSPNLLEIFFSWSDFENVETKTMAHILYISFFFTPYF